MKILSIDGGGTRGIIPATILDCIHQEFGKTPLEIFDLFAGTSTGGIICIGLATGLYPSELVHLYKEQSDDIFYESFLDRVQGADEYWQADYRNDRFKGILTSLFKDKTLGLLNGDSQFGGRGKNLMVCTFDLHPDEPTDRNKNYRPKIFHSSFASCRDTKLVDLALMTSAGPTYFPIYDRRYIDGGVALNNPSMASIAFAINNSSAVAADENLYMSNGKKGLGLSLNSLKLLSLSCGTGNKNRIERSEIKSGNWGNLQWIKKLPDLLTESNMQSTIYYVKQLLAHDQYCRVEAFFDDPEAPHALKTNTIGLDAKDKEILEAMHHYAKKMYEKKKDDIVRLLEL